jgi:TatD DNase family protein
VSEAAAAGVERIVTIGVGRESSERAIALCEAHPEVRAAIGVHPHDADGFTTADEAWIRDLAAHPGVVAIGECGLDFHYDNSARPAQRRAFSAQIGLARETGLPLVIHSRDADADMARILEEESAKGAFPAVLHCFTGGRDLAQRAIALGLSISFTGILTFKNSDGLRAIAAELPADRILV